MTDRLSVRLESTDTRAAHPSVRPPTMFKTLALAAMALLAPAAVDAQACTTDIDSSGNIGVDDLLVRSLPANLLDPEPARPTASPDARPG